MRNYILKRLAQTIPVLFGISVLVFSMLHLSPGDPADLLLGSEATPESVAILRHDMGLDRPLVVQYGAWAGRRFGCDPCAHDPIRDVRSDPTGFCSHCTRQGRR